MAIDMVEALSQMPLTTLAALGINELQRHRSKASFDERYCLEILRCALIEQTDEAWSALQQCFSGTIRVWIRSHPSSDVAFLRDSEENYIAQTFSRFWFAVRDQHLEFNTLYAALSYLRATLNGIIIDTLRSHLHSREVPFPEPGCSKEPMAEDTVDGQSIWNSIQLLLPDEHERRLAYLLYYCGLKPREIIIRCPGGRNRDRLRYVLGHAQ